MNVAIENFEQWVDAATSRTFVSRTLHWKRIETGQPMALLPNNQFYKYWDQTKCCLITTVYGSCACTE